jgi:hypothetical protein
MAQLKSKALIEIPFSKNRRRKKYPSNILYKYALFRSSASEYLNAIGKLLFSKRVKKLYKYG